MVDDRQHAITRELLPDMLRGAIAAAGAVLSITTLNYVIALLTVIYLCLMVYGQLKQHGIIARVKAWFVPAEKPKPQLERRTQADE